ncbi:MAG: hypothetical protein MUF10_13850 [Thermoanaerobaculaceae bacterium]|jgi:cytochrome bd-type quinol oxidase subunit 2|nr:hypothetical protein [Thermoanaerobaculaceae bacterium]
MTGVLSWALVVLLTIRAGRRFIARVGDRRWELAEAWLLLLGGVLLAARSLL